MTCDLGWAEIRERAQSIISLSNSAKIERSRKLIEYLNRRIDQLPNSALYSHLLQDVKFLPVLTKPIEGYVLPWRGSRHSSMFCAPKDVFLPQNSKLIGSSCFIVNTSPQSGCGNLNTVVQKLLGFSSRLPEDRFVIQQLDEAIKFWGNLSVDGKQDISKRFAIESICQEIYEFFNKRIAQGTQNFLNELGGRNWLFIESEFVESKKVAYTSKANAAPFLFDLPSNYLRDYGHLLEAMGIKQAFDDEDYINALHEMQNLKQGNPLTDDELQIAISFINQINVGNLTVGEHIGEIPLPDTHRILRRSKDLVVNLSFWLQDPDDNLKVHGKIPSETAHELGAQSIDYGESYGQHEDLTVRLKGILDCYPPEGILKELVQNADDAEASEIHFIHDTRSLATEKVVIKHETSEEIQGPALCVFNDKTFSDKDLEGLEDLGIGSKQDSPGTTGRYGIGFNSVYHLTDCPSFLSNDEKLVFLDPHCRYLPKADSGRPGELFMVNKIRNKFPNTLKGYLGDYFNLRDSTMFRLPLRRKNNDSKISQMSFDMEKLFKTFKKEARNSLLFLNHIKKITLSRISNNKLDEIYQVETVIAPIDEKKRQGMAMKICNLNGTPTEEIKWEGVSYTLAIKENRKKVEKWLVQQCIGSVPLPTTNSSSSVDKNEIPDGRELGLLPRGGLAAQLWTNSSPPEKKLRGIVCCFLPLPANNTELPVHVNGHFALDNTRRDLYSDSYGTELKSKWNNFLKSCVLAPAYAALITEAQKHLCNDPVDNQLSRYHDLFPKVSDDSPWKTLTIALYRNLGQTKAKVLPLLTPTKSEEEGMASTQKKNLGNETDDTEDTVTIFIPEFSGKNTDNEKATTDIPKTITGKETDDDKIPVEVTGWLSADQAYFVSSDTKNEDFSDILLLLMQIGLPVLLYAPCRIHRGFFSAGITSYEVTPKSVIGFLRDFKCPSSACKISQLPKNLETTAIKNVTKLLLLIKYCRQEKDFGKTLQGLPLLLTQDGYLRVFDSCQPVFGSQFGDLFPSKTSSFVHANIVPEITKITTKSKENIVCDLTVSKLACLLPYVFTDETLRDIEDHETWNFPSEGILSVQWFKKLWNFLQNHAKPRTGEGFASLECLSEWPVIPTTCGKLLKIKNAKTVLDMTALGTESTEQENVRTFLINLKCPVLDREITFIESDTHSSSSSDSDSADEVQITRKPEVLERKKAVTEHYVAHPYNVIDILGVLNHMLDANKFVFSVTDEEEVLNFLKFIQDNYKGSKLLDEHKQIIKSLPFHKALNGQFVSLSGQYSSYALVPFDVPKQQLDELQQNARCLFLDSNALHDNKKLYCQLDVRGGYNVTQFYVEYVFKYFSMFTPETQMQHIIYIGNKVYPALPQGSSPDKEKFLNRMRTIPCIPDENGNLHPANEFFDPQKKIFQLMFEGKDGKFPPSPFNEEDWLSLLKDIGLQVDITPQLFLEFCRQVSEDGRGSPSDQRIHKRSKTLVKHLFTAEGLHRDEYLCKLSKIKFIAPANIDVQLTSIHKQYQCPDNGYPPFIKFHKAVPWYFRKYAWTAAAILPNWAKPNDMALFIRLGIESRPALTVLVNHLLNVISVYTPEIVDTGLLCEIIKSIYSCLSEFTRCSGREPNESCSKTCKDMSILLKDVPCIFLPEHKVFVKAEQLVFKLDCPLKPYLYPVPREFGELEHLLKRLGTTDKPKPSQMAYVLNGMKRQLGEEELSPEDEKKAKFAMHCLFDSLYHGETGDEIKELFLPSQSHQLVKSCDLVCKVSSRFSEIVERIQRPILLSLRECNLKKISDDYINALPEHLRPEKFEDLVREDIDPECKVIICPEARQAGKCIFQEQFETVLRSDKFQVGLKRLLVHGGQNPKAFEQTIKKLQMYTGVKTKCVGLNSVKISVINRDTDDVLDFLEDSSYAVRDEDTWLLYLQHDFKDDRSLESIGNYVNKILGDCIHGELHMLSAMLGCSSPSEIEKKLNNRGITQSTTRSDDEDPEWDSNDEGVWKGGHRTGGYGGHRGGGKEHSSNARDNSNEFYPRNRGEAKRWVKQSKSDLDGAGWLLRDDFSPQTSADPPFNALACFQSHQVVEKCIKAVLFSKCGMSDETLQLHKVEQLVERLIEDVADIPDGLVLWAKKVSNYYLGTRYPNRQPFDLVPAEAYSKNEAEKAVEAASRVFQIVENYLKE